MNLLNMAKKALFFAFALYVPFGICGESFSVDADLNHKGFEEAQMAMSNRAGDSRDEYLGIKKCKHHRTLTYYLYVEDFINSFIEIPAAPISDPSSTTAQSYLAGRAPLYNNQDVKVGTCSASFLSMQNADGIYTDISNYLSVDSGLIVSWFTPTKLINLEVDSIVHSMVTECIVVASTKIGFNPYYGKTFNMVVSSDDEKIYFELKEK